MDETNNYLIDSDDYKLIKRLNEGQYGVVFLVQNKTTNELFAAKALKEINSDEANEVTGINKEIKVLMQCRHPTIVRFHGVSCKNIEGRARYTIFLDYFQNGSLSSILKKDRDLKDDFKLDNTARQIILIGIARGMMYLHQHRVIHNDLKPGNILIDDDLHPHITDFGFSQCFQNFEIMQSMSCNVGTPAYMSPEVISERPYTQKSDVYSFAILMFEIINGTEPYPDLKTQYLIFSGVVDGNLRPQFSSAVRQTVSSSLIDLIEDCWSNDPERRPNFDEIYQKLAYGKDSILGFLTGTEHEYFLDGVDVEKVQKYVNSIEDDDSKNDLAPSKYVDQLAKKVDEIAEQMNDDKISQLEESIKMLKLDFNRQLNMIDEKFQIFAYNLTSALIPDTMTQIPSKFFLNCTRLVSVTIPQSVSVINNGAFTGCTSLTSINIPSSVLIIDCFAFSKCTSLKNINLSPIAILNKNVFSECISLQKIKIPETVKQIDKYAFLYCKSLKYVEIPSTVDLIKRAAFRGCDSLSKVVIKGNTSIENDAFDQCPSLKNVPVPNVKPKKKSFFGYISEILKKKDE